MTGWQLTPRATVRRMFEAQALLVQARRALRDGTYTDLQTAAGCVRENARLVEELRASLRAEGVRA